MYKSKRIFKRVIKSAVLVLLLLGLSNCNQFQSFESTETTAHLSKNPVFDSPINSYAGPDDTDIGLVTEDDDNGGGDEETDNPLPTPEEPVVVVDDTDVPTPGDTPLPEIPDTPLPEPETPEEPIVVVDTPIPLPPFQFCPDGSFQVLERDGTYSKCRPCVTEGTRDVDGVQVPICEVQRCDGKNQYVFFGDDVDRPSRQCERCDVLANNQKKCRIVVKPPVIAQPEPEPVDIPVPPVNPPVRNCRTHPLMPRCQKPTTPNPTFNSGDGGGDGGGDPLMIDTVGEKYASEEELMSNDYTYFKRGTFKLTNPNPIKGVPQDVRDLNMRKNFEGFNLLGNQDQTVLDSGEFLHIDTAGRNFKFKKISWTRTDQNRYQFLVLPNEDGLVLGIDQLFGDNTFGPDPHRPFAYDGFNALMKYDRGDYSRSEEYFSDGYIDHYDAVFSRLRLWHDANGDGNVDNAKEAAIELKTLADFGIAYIHLIPNEKFYETDKYGNDIAYKSIVGFHSESGGIKLGTAFDLWFQYDPRELSSVEGQAENFVGM